MVLLQDVWLDLCRLVALLEKVPKNTMKHQKIPTNNVQKRATLFFLQPFQKN